MTWFGIIKNPKLRASNKLTINLGSNLGSKTEEDDNDCERKMKEYSDKVLSFKEKINYLDRFSSWKFQPPNLPEEVYCAALKLLMQIKPNERISDAVTLDDNDYIIEVEYLYHPLEDFKYGYAELMVDIGGTRNTHAGLYFYLNITGPEEEVMKEVDFR